MKDIIAVEALGGTTLQLTFEGGEQRQVDIAHVVPLRGVFAPLANFSFFRQVRVEPGLGTIVWPNGADLCPDVLYEESQPAASNSQSDT